MYIYIYIFVFTYIYIYTGIVTVELASHFCRGFQHGEAAFLVRSVEPTCAELQSMFLASQKGMDPFKDSSSDHGRILN